MVFKRISVPQPDLIKKEKVTLPYVVRKNELIYPEQPFHDDFLEMMKKIFVCSQWFGVVGNAHTAWKVWGAVLCSLLVCIELGAIYKLVKLLAGLTVYSTGNRSITARIAGVMFYTCSLTTLILTWRLTASWEKITQQWISTERKSIMVIGSDKTLKRRMLFVWCVMTLLSLLEHIMSMASQVTFELPPKLILETYILSSHGFIIVQTDYSIWLAMILLFMSNIATILYNYIDLVIVLMSMGLSSRYYRLNQCVANMCASDKESLKWSKNIEVQRTYMWRKIREAYVKQAVLVRTIDSAIGGLIVLSSFMNFYFICLQLFLGITQGLSLDMMKRIYYIVSLLWLCIRFSSVVLSAANVNVYSQNALRYLHSCSTRSYNVEVDRLQKQLTKDYVALTGMGFFHLNKGILLKVAGAILTYELVLIQFDDHGK